MLPHEHAQISYGQQWKARLAKRNNILKNYVTYKGDCAGRYATIEQFDSLDLEEKTARHENTPAIELQTNRVFMFPKSFNRKVKFDEDDTWKLDKLGVPMPQAAMRLMQAGERKMEEITFAGMLDPMTVGNGPNEGMVVEPFRTSQTVPVNLTGPNTGLTTAKIIEGVRIMMDNEAWGQDIEGTDGVADALCLAASPKSLLNLWKEAVVTSSDFRSFAAGKPFDRGVLEVFFGVKLMVTTALKQYKVGNIQTIPMWIKSKVYYGDWKAATTTVWNDKDTGGDRIRFKFTGGAAKDQHEAVVRILADESV